MPDGPAEEPPVPPWTPDPGLWRRLIDDDAYGWMLVDAEGVLRYYNRAIADLLGRMGDAAIGTSIFDHVAAEDLESALAALVELSSADTEMTTVGLPMVFRVHHADGTVIPVEVGAQNYLDDPGGDLVRIRVRDFGRDDCLHAYLEQLAVGADVPDILHAAVRLADATLIGGAAAIVHDWTGETYRSWVTATVPAEVVDAARRAALQGLPWVASRDGAAHIVSFDDLDGDFGQAATRAGFGSCWAEPITIADDPAPSASLVIFRPWKHRPLVGHLAAARRLRSTLALAFLAQRARERLMQAATTDPLTGLDNRSAAFDCLEEQLQVGPTGVLFVDLDGFKAVNDSRGHGVGDDVLVEVAKALRGCIEPGSVAARIGGDEFLVVVPEGPSVDELTGLAEVVLEALCQPMATDGEPVELGATVGVARFPDHGATPDDLVEAADRALYRAKRAGGRGWAVAYHEGA
jgi:diguanylate cyclase (GGDEF)-like protein/PAS domain S-box-containing protein